MNNSTQISDLSIRGPVELQRADWRFLLPSPQSVFQHLVLLGGPADLPERIIESDIARRVSVTLPADGSADAVAVLSGAQVKFRDIAVCLKPGGALYYEVDRRSPVNFTTTPRRVQRWLRDIGLSPTGVYWAAPDFANRRRYIPLDASEAFRWYLSTLFIAGRPFYRFLVAALRLYTGSQSHRFASIAPCYAVTAIAGSVQEGEVAPSVLGHPGLPPELKIPGQRLVMLTSGRSQAIILPFAPGSRQPTAVVKVSRHARFNRHTQQEQAVLTEIRARLKGAMRRTIPQPLGLLRFGELSLGVESCAPGSPLLVTSGRWGTSFQQQIEDLHLAANWLCEFHRQVNLGRKPWKAAIERWIERPLAAYAEAFGLTSDEKRLFAEVRTRAWSLVGLTLPLIWMHDDFGPWNLYRHKSELTVIDWEFGRNLGRDRFGPALCDLLYFVTHWNHVVQRFHSESAERQGFRWLYIEADHFDKYSKIARQVIADYMAALNIDRRFLPLLLVYTWIDQALVKFVRNQALGEIQLNPRIGNRAVSYISVMARHVKQLFAGWDSNRAMPNSPDLFLRREGVT